MMSLLAPWNPDTDGDNMPDNWEQNYGSIWYGAPGAPLPDPLTPDAVEPEALVKDWGWVTVVNNPWPVPDVKLYLIKHVWVTVEGDVFDISGVKSVTIVVDGDISETIEGNGETKFHFKTNDGSLDVLNAISIKRYFLGRVLNQRFRAQNQSRGLMCYTIEITAEDE